MSEDSDCLFYFGSFVFSETSHALLFNGKPVRLSRRAAGILGYLIQNRHRWVTRQELKALFWKKVSVEDNSVDQQISNLRHALDIEPGGKSYIETQYGSGWKFVENPKTRSGAGQPAVDQLQPAVAGGPPPTPAPLHGTLVGAAFQKKSVQTAIIGLLAAICIAILGLVLRPGQEAKVIGFKRLTMDGRPKFGPLLTDGKRVFFVESIGGSKKLMSVPASGGEALPLNIPLAQAGLEDISADGSKLLLHSQESGENLLWVYSLSSRSLRPVEKGYVQGSWAPDGKTLAVSSSTGLQMLILRGPAQSKINLPGQMVDMKWAPQGEKLRFSLLDVKRESSSEWEIDESEGKLHRLASLCDGHSFVGSGSWTRDGKYFLYKAGSYLHQDIWVAKAGIRKPVQLTNSAFESWDWPIAAGDASTIVALNRSARSELVGFDRNTNSWVLVWNGAPAYELDFSRDSRWVTYTRFPDHTLWKARGDGSEHTQLTNTGLEAHQPHWSPDGSRIAFMGKTATGPWRVFQIQAQGGNPEELAPDGDDQGVPTWAPDGQSVIFGDLPGRKTKSGMSIHRLDLKMKKITQAPNSEGLWSPRWSPNGHYIEAITSDSKSIRILRWPGRDWTELARMSFVDNATWSTDSRYIYFNGHDARGHLYFLRVSVPDGKLEPIADLDGFLPAPENWYGVAPDGTVLAARGSISYEIFALKCVLP